MLRKPGARVHFVSDRINWANMASSCGISKDRSEAISVRARSESIRASGSSNAPVLGNLCSRIKLEKMFAMSGKRGIPSTACSGEKRIAVAERAASNNKQPWRSRGTPAADLGISSKSRGGGWSSGTLEMTLSKSSVTRPKSRDRAWNTIR